MGIKPVFRRFVRAEASMDDNYETETRTDEEIVDSPTIRSRFALVKFETEESGLLSQYGFLRSGDSKNRGWECPIGAQSN
jgi:hypothetical protein